MHCLFFYNTEANTTTTHNLTEFSDFEFVEILSCGHGWDAQQDTYVLFGATEAHLASNQRIVIRNPGSVTVTNAHNRTITLAVRGCV